MRDGGSYTTRRVDAEQRGEVVLELLASFSRAEDGFAHQVPALDAHLAPVLDAYAVSRYEAMKSSYADAIARTRDRSARAGT